MGQAWWAFVYHLRNWGFFYIAGQIKQSSVVILGSISQYRSRTSRSFPKAHLSASDFLSSAGHLLWHFLSNIVRRLALCAKPGTHSTSTPHGSQSRPVRMRRPRTWKYCAFDKRFEQRVAPTLSGKLLPCYQYYFDNRYQNASARRPPRSRLNIFVSGMGTKRTAEEDGK